MFRLSFALILPFLLLTSVCADDKLPPGHTEQPNRTTAKVVTEADRQYWAFRPLQRPTPPTPKDLAWCRTPIDRFILAKLEEKGLAPSAPAERRTLIRRAAFDLVGLPPTPERVEAFLNDNSTDAYERLIDHLLASPHHGERWARHWLDLARFGESHGYEQDYDRLTAYHYRDFVIKALNQDLPYDTFVRWQIAGDELAPNDPLALTATGFLGAGVHSTQITANQVEKERYDELDDIVRTIGTSMLGLTIGCARCHDHKYDPIPTRDYYRLLSTFATTVRTDYEIDFDPAGYKAAKEKWDAEQEKLIEPLARFEKEQLPARFDKWLANGRKGASPPRWAILDLVKNRSGGGATLTKLDDGSVLVSGTNPIQDTLTLTANTDLKGITSIRLDALTHDSFENGGPGRGVNGNFALGNFVVTAAPRSDPKKTVVVKLHNPQATFSQETWEVDKAIDDNIQSAWGIAPQFGRDHAAVFETVTPIGFDGGTVLTFTLRFANSNHGIGRPRLSVSTQPNPAVLTGDQVPETVLATLAHLDSDAGVKLSDVQRASLLRWYRTFDPQLAKAERAGGEACEEETAAVESKGTDLQRGTAADSAAHAGCRLLQRGLFPQARRPEPEGRCCDAELPSSADAQPRWREALAQDAAERLAHIVSANSSGRLDHRCRSGCRPSAGAGDRESPVAAPFRRRPRRHAERFRRPGREAYAPRAARLAGVRIDRAWLEPETHPQADNDERRLHARHAA